MGEPLTTILGLQLGLLKAAAGVIESAGRWRELRMLRNSIAHDYLIEAADRIQKDALDAAPELLDTATRVDSYVSRKGYA